MKEVKSMKGNHATGKTAKWKTVQRKNMNGKPGTEKRAAEKPFLYILPLKNIS